MKQKTTAKMDDLSFLEQSPLQEMEPGSAAPSAGAEEGHGLGDAFDSGIRNIRSSKELSGQAGGGPISANKVSPPLPLRTSSRG